MVGLGDEQFVGLHAKARGIGHVEGVFGVDEGRHAAHALAFGDDVQGKGGFARRFRAVYLGHAAARNAANAKGKVEADGAGGNDGNLYMCAVGKLHDSALTILAFDGAEGGFKRLAAGVFSGNERLFGHYRYLPRGLVGKE